MWTTVCFASALFQFPLEVINIKIELLKAPSLRSKASPREGINANTEVFHRWDFHRQSLFPKANPQWIGPMVNTWNMWIKIYSKVFLGATNFAWIICGNIYLFFHWMRSHLLSKAPSLALCSFFPWLVQQWGRGWRNCGIPGGTASQLVRNGGAPPFLTSWAQAQVGQEGRNVCGLCTLELK